MAHVTFISSYMGTADYGVYVRRLNRNIRVSVCQDSGCIAGERITAEVTPEEKQYCVDAVATHLAEEHRRFQEWLARNEAKAS